MAIEDSEEDALTRGGFKHPEAGDFQRWCAYWREVAHDWCRSCRNSSPRIPPPGEQKVRSQP